MRTLAAMIAVTWLLPPTAEAQRPQFAPPPLSAPSQVDEQSQAAAADTARDILGGRQTRRPDLRAELWTAQAPIAPQAPADDLPVPHSAGNEPPSGSAQAAGDFPLLPPEPVPSVAQPPLPDLDIELYEHGGSYLYSPEGDRLGWPGEHAGDCGGEHGDGWRGEGGHGGEHFQLLRKHERYQGPEPLTIGPDFLGADPVIPRGHWPGRQGYAWEPRFVGYGSYSLFYSDFVQNGRRRQLVGHNAFVELDFQLTGTERFHVQFRPLGKGPTGGSFLVIDPTTQYIDNSTATPTRYWFEGALDSVLGAWVDPFAVRDYNFVVGKFPLRLQNDLLINDEIIGGVLAKNTTYLGGLSNLNWQLFYAFEDVDIPAREGQLLGTHVQWEYRKWFFESSYAYLDREAGPGRDAHWLAGSATRFYGPWTATVRGLAKLGDEAGVGPGQLGVLELNRLKHFDRHVLGIDHAVLFANAFVATEGWQSIGQGNFNRLRTAFEVSPLTQVAAGGPLPSDTLGVSLGAQLFTHHEDQSLVPEVAFESPAGAAVWGLGLRYFRKLGDRTFLEVLNVANFSDQPIHDRRGVFAAWTVVF